MLAIVIPYYKLSFFKETLDSLANQTDKRFKVFIGDDASPENPTDLLGKYQGKFDFVYHRFEKNLGGTSLVQQWERCIALSDNEKWIMILGDDDYLGETVVTSWYENYNLFVEKSNVIRFASRLIYEDEKKVSEVYLHPVWEKSTDSFYRNFLGKSRSSLSEHIFRRISFQKNHFHDFPMAWHSDDRAWLEFSEFNIIYTINEAFVSIRVSDESVTGKKDNLESKNKAKELFYRDLVFSKLSHFNTIQKRGLLLEYGIIAKEQNQLNLENCFYIAFQLARIGSVYTLAKFMRRIFKAKFK